MFENRIRRYLTRPSVPGRVAVPATGFSALPAFAASAGASDIYQIARQQAAEQTVRNAFWDWEMGDDQGR